MKEGKQLVFHYYFPSGEQFGDDIEYNAYQLYTLYSDGSATASDLFFKVNPWPDFPQRIINYDLMEQRTR